MVRKKRTPQCNQLGKSLSEELVDVFHFWSISNWVRKLIKPNNVDTEQSLQIWLKVSVVPNICFNNAKLSDLIHWQIHFFQRIQPGIAPATETELGHL